MDWYKKTTNGVCHWLLLKAKGNRNYPESFSGHEYCKLTWLNRPYYISTDLKEMEKERINGNVFLWDLMNQKKQSNWIMERWVTIKRTEKSNWKQLLSLKYNLKKKKIKTKNAKT